MKEVKGNSMREHKIIKRDLALFWYRDGFIDLISESVSIRQISRKFGEKSEIVFECKPDGFSFFLNLGGRVEVKHNPVIFSSPYDGELVCTICDMSLLEFGIDQLTDFEPDGSELLFWLRVAGRVDWNIFEEKDGDKIPA